MEFSRIDEDTVRCILTEQDMKERGIELEDFFRNKEKVQSFFEEIVEEAKREVAYESSTGVLAVQVMPLPENGLAILFSENQQEPDIGGFLKNIKDMVGELKESSQVGKKPEEVKNTGLRATAPKTTLRIYRFLGLSKVEAFVESLPEDKPIKSSLYKDEESGSFYLVLEKGRLAAKLFSAICERALEFAEPISHAPASQVFLEEHYTCMIKKNAVTKLQRLNH